MVMCHDPEGDVHQCLGRMEADGNLDAALGSGWALVRVPIAGFHGKIAALGALLWQAPPDDPALALAQRLQACAP